MKEMNDFLRMVSLLLLLLQSSLTERPNKVDQKFSTRLPAFFYDKSEFLLSAIIEKSYLSPQLHLVMIFMGHKSFHHMPQMPFLMINNSDTTLNQWKKMASLWRKDDFVNLENSNINCKMNALKGSTTSRRKGRIRKHVWKESQRNISNVSLSLRDFTHTLSYIWG
jgi:hypothetical protein